MLRLIVGYVKLECDSWSDMYHRLKVKLATLKDMFSWKEWTEILKARKQKLLDDLKSNSRNLLAQAVFH